MKEKKDYKSIIKSIISRLSSDEISRSMLIKDISEKLKNRIYVRTTSICPKCGEISYAGRRLILDNRSILRICINCRTEWRSKA